MTNDGKENIVDLYCSLLAATELYKATHKATYKRLPTGAPGHCWTNRLD